MELRNSYPPVRCGYSLAPFGASGSPLRLLGWCISPSFFFFYLPTTSGWLARVSLLHHRPTCHLLPSSPGLPIPLHHPRILSYSTRYPRRNGSILDSTHPTIHPLPASVPCARSSPLPPAGSDSSDSAPRSIHRGRVPQGLIPARPSHARDFRTPNPPRQISLAPSLLPRPLAA